jgi:ribosomal protein S18 acetylase RimI-like enzyme
LPDLVIRLVAPGEGPRLRDLRLRALLADPQSSFYSHETEAGWPAAYWDEWAAGVDRVMFVAVRDDDWLAMAGCVLRDRTLDATGMWVDPVVRGQRLGELLIDAIVAWGRDRGADRMEFAVTETNTVAIALYRRLGFRPTGRRRALDSHPELTGMFMARAL